MGGTDGKGDYATVEKNEKKVNSMNPKCLHICLMGVVSVFDGIAYENSEFDECHVLAYLFEGVLSSFGIGSLMRRKQIR